MVTFSFFYRWMRVLVELVLAMVRPVLLQQFVGRFLPFAFIVNLLLLVHFVCIGAKAILHFEPAYFLGKIGNLHAFLI